MTAVDEAVFDWFPFIDVVACDVGAGYYFL